MNMNLKTLFFANKLNDRRFLISFWTTTMLFVVAIAFILVFLFIQPPTQLNVENGDYINAGFYQINVNENGNTLTLSWAAYVGAFLVLLTTIFSACTYWLYRNSKKSIFIEKSHIYPLLILLNIFVLVSFLACIFSKPLVDISKWDLINNGWNFKPEENSYTIDFNYVYSIQIINVNSQVQYIKIVNSQYILLWILMIVSLSISIISFYGVLMYNSMDYLLFSRKAYYE
ncbi:MAG: hypothetical protein ACRC42_05090 [Mycoplasma sp.]